MNKKNTCETLSIIVKKLRDEGKGNSFLDRIIKNLNKEEQEEMKALMKKMMKEYKKQKND